MEEKKKTLDRINSRMKMTEKKVNEHMKIVSKNYPVIWGSIEKKTEEKLRNLWDSDRSNVHVIKVPTGEVKEWYRKFI